MFDVKFGNARDVDALFRAATRLPAQSVTPGRGAFAFDDGRND